MKLKQTFGTGAPAVLGCRSNDDVLYGDGPAVGREKARSGADSMTHRPVVNAAIMAQQLGMQFSNADRYLDRLTELAYLFEITGGARNLAAPRKCLVRFMLRRPREPARLTNRPAEIP